MANEPETSKEEPLALGVVTPRGRRVARVVALVERDTIAVAELALADDGVVVKRSAVVKNGADGVRWDENEPASTATALATVVDVARVGRRLDAVALSESLFSVQHVLLPPVEKRALEATLHRRLRELVSGAEGEWVADSLPFRHAGKSASSGPNALLAWADAARMREFEAAFGEAGVRVRRIVPPMVALVNLLAHARPQGDATGEIHVHASLPSLCIVLHDGDEMLYARLLRDVLVDSPEQLPDVVLTEVQRTAAFFRENRRGRRIARVVVSGLPSESSASFCRWLSSNAGTAFVPMHVERSAASAPLAAADAGAPDLTAALPTLAGLALHEESAGAPAGRPLNLSARPKSRVPLIAAAAAALVIGVAASAATRHQYEQRESDAARRVEVATAELARRERVQTSRQLELENSRRVADERRALDAVAPKGPNPAQTLVEAMLLVPSGLALDSAKLVRPTARDLSQPQPPSPPTLELRLRGDLSGEGPQLVAQYVGTLTQRPWCGSARSSVAPVAAGESAGALEDAVDVTVVLR